MQAFLNTLPAKDIIHSNRRQQAKLSWKRKEVVDMLNSLKEWFADKEIYLPKQGNDAQGRIVSNMEAQGYDFVDAQQFYTDHEDLIKMYYTLSRSKYALYAQFTADNGDRDYMLLSCWYSRHRLDGVWLWRKSQLIRKAYRNYLIDNYDTLKTKTPTHLVLTMPRENGLYKGKRFYARELLAAFHEMRRSPHWKTCVWGGEYGIEVKKSKSNGLHIHCHSLCYLKEDVSINDFREWVRTRWQSLTGAFMIHCETLYFYEKDSRGRAVYTNKRKKNTDTGQYETVYQDMTYPTHYWDAEGQEFVQCEAIATEAVKVRKKKYINGSSSIEDYLKGILECIKYHFKNDTYKDSAGNWDFDLINEIMQQSRRLRFYSRYGAFYKEKTLSFNYEAEKENDTDDVEMGASNTAEINMINPFTESGADRDEYDIVIGKPDQLHYTGRTAINSYRLKHSDKPFKKIHNGFSLSEIIGSVARGRLFELLEPDHYGNLNLE